MPSGGGVAAGAPLQVIAQQCRILRWAGLVLGLGGLLGYLFTLWRWGGLEFGFGFLFPFLFGVLALLFSAGPSVFYWLARRRRGVLLGEAKKWA
jgi:hypothetical protein